MNTKKLLLVGSLNMAIVIAELGFGVVSNSLALITDALHNLGDVLALAIAFIAAFYALKSASSTMTFGYVRAEMMAAFINSLFLTLTMVFIIYESILRFMNPSQINAHQVIWVALVALIANGISAYLLRHDHHLHHHHTHDHHKHDCDHEHHHETHHHHHEDLNMKAAYLHMLGDAGISLGVVLGGIVTLYWNTPYIDPAISLLFGLYILKSTFGILKSSFESLMDKTHDDLAQYESILLKIESIAGVHDLHVISPSSKEKYFSAHVVLDHNASLEETESILEKIRQKLKSYGITHSVIQPETIKYAASHGLCCSH